MGTLTVGINGLVKKGYAIRKRGEKDRRIVYASLTDKGIAAYRHHENFHKDMIGHITKDLTKEEAEVLMKTFIRLEDFFHQLTYCNSHPWVSPRVAVPSLYESV